MKVWIAYHNPCIYESEDGVISIHKTKAGAEKAAEKHKKKRIKAFPSPLSESEKWGVEEMEMLE